MNKTLRKQPTSIKKNNIADTVEKENEQLPELMESMSAIWKEAATDLLEPRPEAIAHLLKKVLH